MSLKIIIFFTFAIASNLCAANKEGEESESDASTDEYFKILLSEVRHLFHRKPELHYVPPHGIISFTPEKNYTSNSKLIRVKVKNSFRNKEYQLNLVPVKHDVIASQIPMTVAWTVESSPESQPNYTYSIAGYGRDFPPGKFYQDEKMMAMLQVVEKDGINYYDGAIGESLNSQVIRPFPEKWKDEIYSVTHEDHIVYKRSAEASKNFSKKSKDTLYPKLIIVVDYTLFEALGSVPEALQYVSTFWNAVNLKYSVFENPKVKIMITGIVLVKDSTAAPYIYQAERDAKEKHESFKLSNTVLEHGRFYFSKQFIDDTGFHNSDGTILMTASKTAYLGLSFQGAICHKSHSFAYVYDVGDYAGVTTAAHELGHLLNIDHDNISGNEDCREVPKNSIHGDTIGTVMNSYQQYAHENVWTNCSKKALEKLLSQKKAECLRTTVRPEPKRP